jgi:hypothetical protein
MAGRPWSLNRSCGLGFIYVTWKCGGLYFVALERPYRLAVRTPPFHGGGTGSIPVRVAILFSLTKPRVIASASASILGRAFAAALVAPGIDDEENKHDHPENQKYERARLVFPELLEAPGDFVEVHARTNLHQ